MQPTPEQPVSFADFKEFLIRLGEMEISYALIGGLAVSAWAEAHLSPQEMAEFHMPIYSKDIDLRGGKAASMFMMEEMKKAGAEMRSAFMKFGTAAGIRALRMTVQRPPP